MTIFTFLALTICAAGNSSTLSGQVLTLDGTPVPEARVFMEQGLAGSVRESRSDREGFYRFEDVSSGTVGVFAIAGKYAFGGLSVTVPDNEDVQDLTIHLRPQGTLSGKVVNEEGDPVSGARIIRIGLMNEPQAGNSNATTKLGIPHARSGIFHQAKVARMPNSSHWDSSLWSPILKAGSLYPRCPKTASSR